MKQAVIAMMTMMMLGFASATYAGNAEKGPKLTLLKFHADWCGSCKVMGPLVKDLENKFDGEPVLFVTFDRTNSTTRHRSEMLAGALKLGKTYADNAGSGFLLLVDGQGKVHKKFTKADGIKAISAAIKTALGA